MKVVYQPNGIIKIMDKKEIRKEQGESPDYADTVMMAIYATIYYPHLLAQSINSMGSQPLQNNDEDNPFD